MKRKVSKFFAYLTVLAVLLTSVAWPEVQKASAAEEDVIIWTDETKTAVDHETLQEFTLSQFAAVDSNLTLDNIGSAKVQVYIHVTKCSEYSRLKLRGGNLDSENGKGNFSNKELIGKKCTTNTGSNNPRALHAGYRTKGGYGSGVGVAESGNYQFYDTSVNKTNKDSTIASTNDSNGIRLTRMTNDVEAYIIGIVFGSVGSVSIDAEGNITKGFDPSSITLESQEYDDSDITDEEWEAVQDALDEEAKKEIASARAGLKAAIDACNAFSEDDYEATSLAKVKAAIPAAQEAWEKEDDTKENYRAARDTLENVRADLVPKMTTDAGNPKEFRILSKTEVIDEMGAGINLGNTLDGGDGSSPGETNWQAYKTTKAYIKALHDAGYNTVRVPVTWGVTIDDDNNFAIDEAWINRVQEVVDYCVDQDMYCIINIHHDGIANHDYRGDNPQSWLNTAADDIEYVYTKFAGAWKSIANRFKDYDEHLIFESMNEVTDAHYLKEGQTNDDAEVLNNLNQIFVNAVRSTGSNNTKRWLALTGRFATFSTGTTMPSDTLADSAATTTRLMFAVHIYKGMHSVRRTYNELKAYQTSLSSTVKNVKNLSADMPIYIGEYGQVQQAQPGSATGYNNLERALDGEFFNAISQFYGVCPVVWDQGDGDYTETATHTGLFNYWNRPALEPVYADTIEGTMRGTYLSYDGDVGDIMTEIYKKYGNSSTSANSIATAPDITEVTSITVDEKVTMKAGERKTLSPEVAPANTDDVILWSTDDDSVVTVANGRLHAKGAGVTTVHVYSQSESVTKDIKVVVSPSGNETATSITTEKSYYELETGNSVALNPTLLPADSEDRISYTSSNINVATVSSAGIVTAENVGSTYIIATAASGVSTIVKIKVNKTPDKVNVALNAIVGGITESSKPITIMEDGQYTLTYDMSTELSEAGKAAGITKLEDMTAVFIKDTNSVKSVVEAAQIRYDKIVVNDTELTLTTSDFKSALKSNGQFDTNDPINGWDGSVVKEVKDGSQSKTVSFSTIDNPTKISLTFTIKDLKFFATEETKKEATSMTGAGEKKIKINEVGDSKDIELTLNPTDTDSKVTFYSTNSSIVAVETTAKTADANGKITAKLTGVSEGTAMITAITENGLRVVYSVGVGNVTVPEPADPTPNDITAPSGGTGSGGTGNGGSGSTNGGSTDNNATDLSQALVLNGYKAGKSFTLGNFKYTVTKEAKKAVLNGKVTATRNGTVKVTALSSKGKKAKKLTIPGSVTSAGAKYTVTALKGGIFAKAKKATSISLKKATAIKTLPASAFKNAKKVKSIVLNKAIKKIPASAFTGCKKLSKLTISAKLTKVTKKAFKGCKKKIKLSGAKGKTKKSNIKLLKKSGYKKFK